ncbi:MAG: tRNA pseudouridine(38-40) synthase TruA [Fusobacterium sp.]
MRNIKLTYSYDGSCFFGFQKQPNKRTVQGELEKSLNLILKDKINLISSGRTDRGVHAKEQVSNFLIKNGINIPINNLLRALNNLIPNDIEIFKIEEVPISFHSRYMAKKRTYEYLITWRKDVFSRKYKTYIPKEINPLIFYDILKPLIGIHDFNNFRLKDSNNRTSIREIFKIKTSLKDSYTLCVFIEGNAFLKTQIRIIMGIALDIYFNKKPSNYIKLLLKEPNIVRKIEIADPYGLYLFKINY